MYQPKKWEENDPGKTDVDVVYSLGEDMNLVQECGQTIWVHRPCSPCWQYGAMGVMNCL